jgi:hypothetical protein
MTQPFAPQDHLIKIPRRVKTASGAWETVHDDYLEVKFRLVMFREKYPHGRITTEEVCVDLDRGYARFKATIEDGEGGLATGYGTETKAGFADYVERSETRALGRALAVMGFGTQFVGSDMSEGEHIVDAPVTTTITAAPDVAHETPGMSHPLPVGEGGTAGAPTLPATNGHSTAPEHPTESHLAALKSLVVESCGADVGELHERVRFVLGLPQGTVISKGVMGRLSMEQYMRMFEHFTKVASQLAKVKGKETPGGTTPTTQPVSQPAPAPTKEGCTAVPSPAPAGTSSPAPEPGPNDAAERDRVRLRAEVAQWDLRVPPEEVEHVIQHNPYSKARALLWKCRRQDTAA